MATEKKDSKESNHNGRNWGIRSADHQRLDKVHNF